MASLFDEMEVASRPRPRSPPLARSDAHVHKVGRMARYKDCDKLLYRERKTLRDTKYGAVKGGDTDSNKTLFLTNSDPESDSEPESPLASAELPAASEPTLTLAAESETKEETKRSSTPPTPPSSPLLSEEDQEWLGVGQEPSRKPLDLGAGFHYTNFGTDMAEYNAKGVKFYRLHTVIKRIFQRDMSRDQLMDLGSTIADCMERSWATRKLRVHDYVPGSTGTYMVHHYTDADLPRLILALAANLRLLDEGRLCTA